MIESKRGRVRGKGKQICMTIDHLWKCPHKEGFQGLRIKKGKEGRPGWGRREELSEALWDYSWLAPGPLSLSIKDSFTFIYGLCVTVSSKAAVRGSQAWGYRVEGDNTDYVRNSAKFRR